MKKLTDLLCMSIAVSTLCVSSVLFANEAKKAEFVQTLRQASDELKGSNPGLSDKLKEFADKKEKMHDEKQGHLKQKEDDVAKVRQASSQLQTVDAGLSKDLRDMADRWDEKIQKIREGKE